MYSSSQNASTQRPAGRAFHYTASSLSRKKSWHVPPSAENLRSFSRCPDQPGRAVFPKLGFDAAKVGDGFSRLGFQVIDVLLPGCQQRLERAHVDLEFTAFAAFFRPQSSHQRQNSRSLEFGRPTRLDADQFTRFLAPGFDAP